MNCHATRRCDQPRRERGEGRFQDEGRRKGDSTVRDEGTPKSGKFVGFARLYKPKDCVRFRWKQTGEG